MSFILPTLLVMTQSVGLALPTLNTTSAHVPSWSSSCDGLYHFRSLLSLVWSCLTTTFLCTWVAMHPNVPAEGDTAWVKRFTSSLSYLAGMLIAPEAIVFRAFQEWIVACNLIKTLASSKCSSSPLGYIAAQPDTRTAYKCAMDRDSWDDGSHGRV